MAEETKLLVAELNALLKTDHNLSSFESLTRDQSLALLCDALAELDAMPRAPSPRTPVAVLEALRSIKYSPPVGQSPSDFREGIATGDRRTIRPILQWLVANPKQVRRRAYLAKYVEKVDCPSELLDDPDVRALRLQYEGLIEEFWRAYGENGRERKNARETRELQQDVARMEDDTVRICVRIEQQKEKVESVPNKESLLGVVRAYRNEVAEGRKLREQLERQREAQSGLENEAKELRRVRTQATSGADPLKAILNELRTNGVLLGRLPEELALARRDCELYELVAAEGSEISSEEAKSELGKLNDEIQALVEKKLAIGNDGRVDELAPFRNQAAMVANKKREVSNAVMELKDGIASLDEQIADKENLLMALVGGPLLQGENLKNYVSKLREHNVLYKEYKNQLRALTTEQGILTRTHEVLKSDPAAKEAPLEIAGETETDSKPSIGQLRKMAADADKMRAETAQAREELRIYSMEAEPFFNEHARMKEAYEEAVGPIREELRQVDDEVRGLKERIADAEGKWKDMRGATERKEEMLVRLREDGEREERPMRQVEELKERLAREERVKETLEKQMHDLERRKAEGDENLDILENIVKLLKAKEESAIFY